MRTSDSFMNVYEASGENDGYHLRLCQTHIEYFAGHNDKSLRQALKSRNRFYVQQQYLPESLLMRYAKPCEPVTDSETGFSGVGIQIAPERFTMPYVIVAKVQHLKTRQQRNVRFSASNLAIKKTSELKEAIATRNKNVSQHNQIAEIYNKMRLRFLMPFAVQEARTLKPILHTFNKFDSVMWEQALKRTFPKGLEKIHLARE